MGVIWSEMLATSLQKIVLPKSNPLKIERIADQISGYSSLFVLALVLIPILLPRFF